MRYRSEIRVRKQLSPSSPAFKMIFCSEVSRCGEFLRLLVKSNFAETFIWYQWLGKPSERVSQKSVD
mgnify:CR=1 FL=1